MTDTAPRLAQAAAAHMDTNFPDTYYGGWTVAEDERDGTAVVVWRQREYGGEQGLRGRMLYRWLESLRAAGFTVEPRLDLEVFGRPDEQSEIAHWLHVTARVPVTSHLAATSPAAAAILAGTQ